MEIIGKLKVNAFMACCHGENVNSFGEKVIIVNSKGSLAQRATERDKIPLKII